MLKAFILGSVILLNSQAYAAIFDSIESVDVLRDAHPTANRVLASEKKADIAELPEDDTSENSIAPSEKKK